MCFVLKDVERHDFRWELHGIEGGDQLWVYAIEFDSLREAYLKLRSDLLEIMDNPDTPDEVKAQHVEHMISYQGLRASVPKV